MPWLLALLPIPQAQATRPFLTDEAAVSARGELSIEAWVELAEGEALLPLVGTAGISDTLELNLELTTGWVGGRLGVGGPGAELKWLLSPARPGGLPGGAFAMGAVFPFGDRALAPSAVEAYGLVAGTWRLLQDGLWLHGNLGVTYEVGGGLAPLWGLGTEVPLALSGVALMGEVYADDPGTRGGTLVQGGVVWRSPEEAVQLDATVGAPLGGGGPRATLGVVLVSAPLW